MALTTASSRAAVQLAEEKALIAYRALMAYTLTMNPALVPEAAAALSAHSDALSALGYGGIVTFPSARQLVGQGIYQVATGLGLTTAMEAFGRIPLGPFPYAMKSFQVPLDGFYISSAFVQTPLPKVHTVKCSIEIIGNGSTQSIPILWNGSATKTLNPSDVLGYSDDWCVLNGPIPAGTRFHLRYDVQVPTAGILASPQAGVPSTGPYFATLQYYNTLGVCTDDINGVGTISSVGAAGNQSAPPMIFKALCGSFDTLKTSAFVIGNSKWTGTTADGVTDGVSGKCAISRALYDMNVPNMNLALAGTTFLQWAALAQSAYAWAANCTDAFIGDPCNDASTGQTLAQIQANFAIIVGKIRTANPSIRIWGSRGEPVVTQASFAISSLTSTGTVATATVASTATLVTGQYVTLSGATPTAYNGTFIITVTSATTFTFNFAGGTSPATGTPVFNDACTLLANQTPVAGCEQTTGVLCLYNIWLPSQVAGGQQITGYVDPCEVAEVGGAGGSGRWVVLGTLDGTHPRDRMYSNEGIAFKRQLLAQGFRPNTGAF